MPDLLAIADELYALPLADFTPARDARAKELKGTDLAAPVKGLRKPSTGAWVVNLLVRHESEQVDQVLTLGEALREAQASMSADELRTLTKQRRQLTAAVTTRARSVAADHGQRVTEAVADQVQATLTAAMVDAECARAVRSGLLVATLASTGVDRVEVAAALALPAALGYAATARTAEPPPRPELHVVPDPEAHEKALAAARSALEDADAELDDARSAYDEAHGEVTTLEARALQVQGEIDELRRRLAELESTAEQIDDDLGDAEDARSEAQVVLDEAQQERDRASAALDRVAPPR
ncbi:MAG: hypothetical protein F2667_13630 [Actinobacteria bacterium]|uniref:Unannotated protein n=1 Tax=freshwater metagenome TaxID=449393 RepID=A0A6J6S937_9ZZZZ|nr:hypothetical protein [Actinomycetota bacterium]